MKKLLILIIPILILTGCSKEKLTCTKKEKSNGYKSTEEYSLQYKKDKLTYYTYKTTYEFNEFYTEEEIKKEQEKVEEVCNYFKQESNNKVKCKIELKNKVLSIKMSLDISSISEDIFDNMMFLPLSEFNKEKEMKKMFKNTGYTCK